MRILLAEDDELVAETLADTLATLGHTVAAVTTTYREAIAAAAALPFDAAILDRFLVGKGDVGEVANVLRKREIPCIVTSGYPTEDLPDALRGQPFLRKPFSLKQLKDTLEHLTR